MAKLTFLEFASSVLQKSPLMKDVKPAKQKVRSEDPAVLRFLEIREFFSHASPGALP